MSSTALDEQVARKLGHKLVGGYLEHAAYLPAYSTNIKAAWEIVEHIELAGFFGCLEHRKKWWVFEVVNKDGEIEADDEADTAPMAICKAFLKLDVVPV